MQRNIGTNGRIARAITGVLTIGVGIVLLVIERPESSAWRWTLALVSIAAGVFQLFEARRGWCAARACGIKTPM